MKAGAVTGSKSETLRELSQAVLGLEVTKGHLLWKVTDLVRKTGFSRALVYRYLGSSKTEILRSALKNFIHEFYGFEGVQGGIAFVERIRQARGRLAAHPELSLFYIKWRSKTSELQAEFMDAEARYRRRLKKIFPKLSDHEILTRHAVMHGLVTAPFLSPEEAMQIYQNLFASVDRLS
mgnify:CR=1 FL=1